MRIPLKLSIARGAHGIFALFFLSTLGKAAVLSPGVAAALDSYNVVWDSPSAGSRDSMPCGGHDIGLNAWVEGGDLLFYVGRSGAFDENNSLLKLGRVRVRLRPNPFVPGTKFRQELKLRSGDIEIVAEQGGNEVRIRLWVEVARPVIHCDVSGVQPVSVEASYESWRIAEHPLSRDERMQCLSFLRTDPAKIALATHPDVVLEGNDRVVWYHRNRRDDMVFDKEVTLEHLDAVKDQLSDPNRDLTFGGVMEGPGFVSADPTTGTYAGTPFRAWRIRSAKPRTRQTFELCLHTEQASSAEAWESDLDRLAADSAPSEEEAWKANLAWWEAFWSRSYVLIDSARPDPSDPGWVVGRNYQLFRYTLGCNAYGEYPSKFNGSLFTVDPEPPDQVEDFHGTPDYRAWGGGSFTAQNQRLLYWPMLKSGDFEMMKPQFEFYLRGLKNAEVATRFYWGHGGAAFSEQLENFGLPIGDIYESTWGRRGLGPRPGDDISSLKNLWVSDLYDTVLEFCGMIVESRSYSGKDISRYLPLVTSCVAFFDQHYRLENRLRTGRELDADGRLVLFPSTAGETYKNALNPTNTIVGLDTLLGNLLKLPPRYGSPAQRESWNRIRGELPPISFRSLQGKRVISPAASWGSINNEEFPQMYPVFPWHRYGIGRPELGLALDTWNFGADDERQKEVRGWHQSAIFVADMGLKAEAQAMVAQKLANSSRRFPTFWGPNYDYVPDFNSGGCAMIALQEMLLQTNSSDAVQFLPAWPSQWKVVFKLHASQQRTVEVDAAGSELRTNISFETH